MATIKLKPANQPEPVSVEITPSDDNILVTVDEQRFMLAMHWDSLSGGWVREEQSGRIIPFYSWLEGDTLYLWMLGRTWQFERESRSARRQAGGHATQEAGDIKAPMPGNILKIMVQAGDVVEANTPLLVMESMKMEMTISSPAPGRVVDIVCDIGQLVAMNALLIKMEAVKDEPVLSQTS